MTKVMFSRILKIILLFILISAFIFPSVFTWAEKVTSTNQIISTGNPSNLIEEQKALEEELKKLEVELKKLDADISKTEREKRTLRNQISLLRQRIRKSNLEIHQSNIMIRDINFQIGDTETSIKKTSLKTEDSLLKLAAILRRIYEEDQKSLLEILLSEKTLSGFFDNLMALETLNLRSQEFLDQIKNLKSELENQKIILDEEKTDLKRVLDMQVLQKEESEAVKKEKNYFLRLTESQYQKYLREREATQKRAAEIRARIFELIGVPEVPTFGQAYELAKYVEEITGIRPAFLLAILTQESNIGRNVGQCFLANPTTGEGVRIRGGAKLRGVMAPGPPHHRRRNDVRHFLEITRELGRDPYQTLVSCPISDPRLGLVPGVNSWGGAMGPAQFIPSTWMRYRDRVKAITGRTADPWNIKDSFLAAGLKLADHGAAAQTNQGEWRAAMIYFAGTINLRYRFYGDSVMRIARQYQEDIGVIEKGGLTRLEIKPIAFGGYFYIR